MSVFVDTGIFVAAQNKRDANHKSARAAIDRLLTGELGRAFTSDYVFDETVTLARVRTGSLAEASLVASRILGRKPFPHVFDMAMVNAVIFRDALRILESYKDKPLSFTDATSIAIVRRRGIGTILSFDADFDGLVERLDPRSG
ncbi:MAG TPA: type II toxin-antitoxin system VapC family toxin [Candidatus Thermoplasmatota archaeon]|nr:type II toxin-antitoxin system VapC family toxin [Candidatus Thermoplasmatota archaeon]